MLLSARMVPGCCAPSRFEAASELGQIHSLFCEVGTAITSDCNGSLFLLTDLLPRWRCCCLAFPVRKHHADVTERIPGADAEARTEDYRQSFYISVLKSIAAECALCSMSPNE